LPEDSGRCTVDRKTRVRCRLEEERSKAAGGRRGFERKRPRKMIESLRRKIKALRQPDQGASLARGGRGTKQGDPDSGQKKGTVVNLFNT